jgi:hypothetical protein
MPRARPLKSRPFPGKKTARSRQKVHR